MQKLKLGQTSNTTQLIQTDATKPKKACRPTNRLALSHLKKRKPCEHQRVTSRVETHLRNLLNDQIILGYFKLCIGSANQPLIVGFQVFTHNLDQCSLVLPAPTDIGRSKLFHTQVRPLFHRLRRTSHKVVELRGTHSKEHIKLIASALNHSGSDYALHTNSLAQSKIDKAERIFQHHQNKR